MTKIDNPTRGEFNELLRKIRQLEYSTPLSSAQIGRGGITVNNGGMITIENGGLKVTGTAEIIGRLIATGLVNFAGEVIISGPLDVSGEVDVSGIMQVFNDLELKSGGRFKAGEIEFLPDGSAKFATLTIANDGTLKTGATTIRPDGKGEFGGMTLDPSLFGGSVQFAAGGYLSGTATGPQLTGPLGNAFVYVRNALAGIQAAAINLVGAVTIQGGLKLTSLGNAPGATANVHIDDQGNVRRIT